MSESTNCMSYSIRLNNEPIEGLCKGVFDNMAQNLSRVVSLYFMQHPDELDAYLNSIDHQGL